MHSILQRCGRNQFDLGLGAATAVALVVCASAAGSAVQSTDSQEVLLPKAQLDSLFERLDSLEQDNDSLRSEVATLRSDDETEWLTNERAAEIRGIVQDVLADSAGRTSLRASGATAGWTPESGFYLRSDDDRFLMEISGMMQARYMWSRTTGPGYANSVAFNSGNPQRLPPNEYGFDLPNTRLQLKGHVFEPGIRYFLRGEIRSSDLLAPDSLYAESQSGGVFDLLDAYVAFDLDNDWAVQIGQFKLPFSRESLVSVQNLLTAGRSSVDELMGIGRSQGVQIATRGDDLYWAFAFSDGGTDNLLAGLSNNSGYFPAGTHPANSPYSDNQASYAFTSRVEYKLSGDWNEFREMTSPMGEAEGIMLGLGAHFQMAEAPSDGGFTPTTTSYVGTGGNTWLNVTADASWNIGGASLFASIYYTDTNTKWSLTNPGGGQRISGTTNLLGVVLQGAMYVTPKWEVFARYEYVDPTTEPSISVTTGQVPVTFSAMSLATIGANWYIDGQDLRWNFQLGYAFNEVSQVAATPDNGFRPLFESSSEFVFMTQLQLQF